MEVTDRGRHADRRSRDLHGFLSSHVELVFVGFVETREGLDILAMVLEHKLAAFLRVQQCLAAKVFRRLWHVHWGAHAHVDGPTMRQEPERVVEDSPAKEERHRETHLLLQVVLDATRPAVFVCAQHRVRVVLSKRKHRDQISAVF
jgi:hypothetical protein